MKGQRSLGSSKRQRTKKYSPPCVAEDLERLGRMAGLRKFKGRRARGSRV